MIYNHVCFVVGICFAVFTLVSHTFASYFSLRQELGIEGELNAHELFVKWEYREQFWVTAMITCFIISVCMFIISIVF